MQVRTLLVGGAVVVALVLARRGGRAEVTAPKAVAATIRDAKIELPAWAVEPAVRTAALPALPVPDEDDGADEEIEIVEEPGGDVVSQRMADLSAALDTTKGGYAGQVFDSETGEPLPGATIVLASAARTEVAVTDEQGWFAFTNLPPTDDATTYAMTTYYNDTEIHDPNVWIKAGEIVPISQWFPANDYIKNIPTGRTFEATLGAAAGSSEDDGISFSGVTSLETTYVIE